jgi:hypothetical protein
MNSYSKTSSCVLLYGEILENNSDEIIENNSNSKKIKVEKRKRKIKNFESIQSLTQCFKKQKKK